jgi:Zn-dependent M28 family amino/carboxypeptidase
MKTGPRNVVSLDPVNFPVLFTSKLNATKVLGIDSAKFEKIIKRTAKKHKPVHFPGKSKFSIEVDRIASYPTSDNIIGYVQGSDLKDEYIVISAHYDHLGMHKGKIYFGADDDGSGTTALLEIAQAFTLAKNAGHGPRRSILFCAFSGEEKGLLGSEYYTKHPLVPLSNTILDLNIDMIGRLDSTYTALQNPNYIYPIGSNKLSSSLKPLLEEVNSTYTKLKLDYKYDAPDDKNRFYYRSDHYNFAKNNIPVIFFFNGTHADYHKSTDTMEKINFEKMQTITRLVFYMAWTTANQEERLKTDLK